MRQTKNFLQNQAKYCAEKHSGSVSTELILVAKDPTKSLKCVAKLQKKGEEASSTGSSTSKKVVVTKTVTKPSHSSKEKSMPKEQRSGSQPPVTMG